MPAAPTIHLNGTSRDRLCEALEAATDAIEVAYTATKGTAPNGRDYYPQGESAIDAATQEHMARLRKLDEVRNELAEILYKIAEQ